MDAEYRNVFPTYVGYHSVLLYLKDEILRQALDSDDIESILDREFGITPDTPEDVQKYVFHDLREWFRTSDEGGRLVFYKRLHDLEEYRTEKALSNLFG